MTTFSHPLESSLAQSLARLPAGAGVCVAYSGGLDSELLLSLLARLAPTAGHRLRAVHVHHGLSRNADLWAEHCRQRASDLSLPFRLLSVKVAHDGGLGLEAAAREARYQALAAELEPGEYLATGHHRSDQAETVLLRLLRGSGPQGLAAMTGEGGFAEGRLWRPWLAVSREVLSTAARGLALSWVEDESNDDRRLDRNYLRHELMPRLTSRWPAAERCLARSAELCAEASELLAERADEDLRPALIGDGRVLDWTALQGLSPARRRNALRRWWQRLGWPALSQAQLERVMDDVLGAAGDANPVLRLAYGELHRYRQRLYALTKTVATVRPLPQDWPGFPRTSVLDLGDGRLQVSVVGEGLRAPRDDETVNIRFRRGGERFHPHGRGHGQELRKLFQEAGVLPWWRERLPLVYYGDTLVAVPGVGIAATAWQAGGEAYRCDWYEPSGQPHRFRAADYETAEAPLARSINNCSASPAASGREKK